MNDFKHITICELDAPNSYLFKVGNNHDWDERKVPVFRQQVQVGNETVVMCVNYQPLLRTCVPIIARAYLEASFRKWKKTWYAVVNGRLLQTVEQPEFDEVRTPM